MDDFAQFRSTFFTECGELLGTIETQLGALQQGSSDPECLHTIFRGVHTIKAGAGALKFTLLAEYAHEFKAVLDRMRSGGIALDEAAIATLFKGSDVLADCVSAAENGEELAPGHCDEVLCELAELGGGSASKAPLMVATEESEQAGNEATYRIRFQPAAELFRHANEPLLLVRELMTLGPVAAEADLSRLPELAKMDVEDAYLGWTFEVRTGAGQAAIEEVFEFVVDDCELTIERHDETDDPQPGTNAASDTTDGADSTAKSGDGLASAVASSHSAKVSSIRVDLDRIDLLVNMVGELVITQSMLSQQTSDLPADRFPAVSRGLEELAMHTRELQESVMAIRMQPVKSVFTRMPRLVRELTAKLGKKARLVTHGEDTEVDKTVVEEISDPITHMIRNSLDHGLENPDEREAAGKPAEGTVQLSAEHRGGRIVITIEDDGRGIDREAVLKRARERGVVTADATLSSSEIDNLIFTPGFSTAEEVTDVSGRGVGMDVVRRNIQALGGRISIHSTPGKGSCFTITLPLTLAVMDGMIVVVGGEKYIIPITNIIETIRPAEQDVRQLPNGDEVVAVRGEFIGLVYVHRAFNLAGRATHPSKGLVVLAETEGAGKVGLVVDELVGQQQVVIKSLESNYDPVPGISAATILGNGKVAPILDIETLRVMVQQLLTGDPDGEPSRENGGSGDGLECAAPHEALTATDPVLESAAEPPPDA